MYNIGDVIVHPMHGAGTIEDITSRTIDNKVIDYYVFKLPTSSITILVPVEKCAEIGIRNIISEEQADELLSLLGSAEIEEAKSWNRRYRENAVRIKSGDLTEVVIVIKNLEFRDMKNGLSTGERKMLHSARQILTSELVLAKNKSYDEIISQMNIILAESFKNI